MSLQAATRRDAYRDIRMLSMGNAGLASISNGNSVFYNPAGLAFYEDFRLQLIDVGFATNRNVYDSTTEILSLSGGDESLIDRFAPLLGKKLGLRGSIFPHVATPNFLFGVWDYLDVSFAYHDPVYPRIELVGRNDYGIVTGFGKKIYPGLSVGLSIRYIKRRAITEILTADTLLANTSALFSDIDRKGEGWGLNLGTQYRMDLSHKQQVSLGVAVEDVGQTRLRNSNRNIPIPARQAQKVNAGVSYGIETGAAAVTVHFDMRDLVPKDYSYTKRMHMGIEIGLPWLDVRGGLYQGYWSAGATIGILPLFDIDLASWAEERGAIAGQFSDRFFMIGLRFGMELKKSKGPKKQRFSLDDIK